MNKTRTGFWTTTIYTNMIDLTNRINRCKEIDDCEWKISVVKGIDGEDVVKFEVFIEHDEF